MQEIIEWLRKIGLEHYNDVFRLHAIDFDVLDRLTDADMSELGIAMGDRYRLKSAIASFKSEGSSLMGNQAHFRQLTVLFSDLVGSTLLSTQLDAEKYRTVLRSYQKVVVQVMENYGGTVTRFEGDGIMVLFGFPLAHEDVPDRAVCAALDSIAGVAKLHSTDSCRLASRIGIATGEVVVGDQIGTGPSRQFAVSGSTPNLAARLQSLAEPNSVVASDTTVRLTKTAFDITQLPPTKVKGITEPVQAFVINGERVVEGSLPGNEAHLTPLIARQSECNQLRRSWTVSMGGKGMLTVIQGEAGIGKSRLVEEFVRGLNSEQVARFFCLPRYQNSMLHPLIQQLRDSRCLARNSANEALGKNAASLPGLVKSSDLSVVSIFERLLLFSDGETTHENARIEKEQLFGAILHQLKAVVTRGVSVIVVEDLHWADPTSLELLERIAGLVSSLPLLMLITVRPDRIPDFAKLKGVNTLKLLPLELDDSLTLIEEIAKRKSLSAQDTKRILDRCDGVPLYLQEITRAVMDEVDVSILERRTTAIPETLRDLLMARLDRLGSGAVLAQIASVLGRSFTVRQLQTISGLSSAVVKDGLAGLEKAKVLIRLEDSGEQGYQFNHSLTANAAYASLLSEHKVLLHAKIARMLDADPITAEREPETAAGHYEWAGELEPAIRLRELAGYRASVRSANVEAAYHFNKAVTLAVRLPASAERKMHELRLRLELGTQLIACYGNAAHQVESNFERARELCDQVSDQSLQWQTLYGLWSIYQVNGRLRAAHVLGQELIDLATRLNSSSMLVLAYRAHGLCQFAMGEFEQSRLHLERTVDIYDPELHAVEKTGDISDTLVLAKCNLGWLYCFQGETERSLELHEEAIQRAEQLEHQHSLAFALALSAASHQALEDRGATRLLAQRLVNHSHTQGYPYWLAWGKMLLEWAQPGKDSDMAANEFDSALIAYEKTGGRMMNAYFMTLRAELEIGQQLYSDALTRLMQAEQLVGETATRFYMAEIPRLRAVIYAQRGEFELADRMLKHADKLATQQGNKLLKHRIDTTRSQTN